jgi:hypothetical protein
MIMEIEKSNFWEHGLSSLQHSYVHLEILLIGRLKKRQFTPHKHKIIGHHNHQFSGGGGPTQKMFNFVYDCKVISIFQITFL